MSRYRKLPPGVKPPLGWVLDRASPQALRLALWLSNEGAGTLLGDATRRGNSGTLNAGVTWTPGRTGPGLLFNGSTGRVAVPASLPCDGDFTFSTWVYPTRTGNYIGLFSTDANSVGTRLACYISDTGLLYFSGSTNFTGTHALTYNAWNHVAYVRSGNVGRTHLNGKPDASGTLTWGTVAGQAKNIGGGWASTDRFGGRMDVAKFDARALSDAEIAQEYASPFGDTAPPSSRSLFAPSAAAPTVATGNLWYYSMIGRGL